MILRELDQIKAISQGYRITIIESFGNEPATAKQISDCMGEPHAKINYHIKTLVKVGILELVEENIKLGIVEKYYCPIARDYIVDSSSFTTNENARETVERANVALFEHVSKVFFENVESTGIKPPKKFNHFQDIYLTEDEAEELNTMINDQINFYIQDKLTPREDKYKYSMTALIIPIIKK
jgi:predicted transcriptional regulator